MAFAADLGRHFGQRHVEQVPKMKPKLLVHPPDGLGRQFVSTPVQVILIGNSQGQHQYLPHG